MLSRTNIMNVVTNVSYECIMNAVSHDTRSSIHKCLLRTFINVCTLDLHKCSPLRLSVSLTNLLSRSPGRGSRSVARTPSLWARTPSLWASSRKRLSVDRVEKEAVCWERESERNRERERRRGRERRHAFCVSALRCVAVCCPLVLQETCNLTCQGAFRVVGTPSLWVKSLYSVKETIFCERDL